MKNLKGLLLYFALGLVFFFIGIDRMIEVTEQRNWQPGQGVVLETRIVPYGGEGSFGSEPYVVYQYKAAGNVYQGSTILYTDADILGGVYQWSKVILEKIPPGKAITVYYDPKRPDRSAVDNSLVFGPFGLVFFKNFGAILFSGFLFLAGIRIGQGRLPETSGDFRGHVRN